MIRKLPGGQSVFPTQSRPNIFNKLPVEELIERNGEDFIWLRLLPSTELEEGNLALPDQPNKGFIISYERERKIVDETIQLMTIQGQTFQTIYSPITKIHKLYVKKHEIHGSDLDLPVRSFTGNTITLTDDILIKPWYQIQIDYSIKSYETTKEEFELPGGHILPIGKYPKVMVKVNKVLIRENPRKWQEIPFTHDFLNIYLRRRYPEGTRLKVEYDAINTIKLAYKAVELKDVQLNEKGTISVMSGDFEAVCSPYLDLSKGDILVNSVSSSVEKELVTIDSKGRYRLKYSPIKELVSITDGVNEYLPDDFLIEDYQYIRFVKELKELPQRLSLIYSYHPIYKIVDSLTVSGQAGRLQPRKYLLRPDLTNSILSYINNSKKIKA